MVTAPVAVLAMSMIIGSAMGAADRLASPEAAGKIADLADPITFVSHRLVLLHTYATKTTWEYRLTDLVRSSIFHGSLL